MSKGAKNDQREAITKIREQIRTLSKWVTFQSKMKNVDYADVGDVNRVKFVLEDVLSTRVVE